MDEAPTKQDPSLTPAQARACGIGLGEECCIFLVMTGGGFACGREMHGVYGDIMSRKDTMNAQHEPADDVPHPDCQPA